MDVIVMKLYMHIKPDIDDEYPGQLKWHVHLYLIT